MVERAVFAGEFGSEVFAGFVDHVEHFHLVHHADDIGAGGHVNTALDGHVAVYFAGFEVHRAGCLEVGHFYPGTLFLFVVFGFGLFGLIRLQGEFIRTYGYGASRVETGDSEYSDKRYAEAYR